MKKLFPRIPWHAVSWKNSAFLMLTLALTVTVVPIYLWTHGLSAFQAILFLWFFIATGLSITLGYHRLFSHLSFKASWPVRFFTLCFGAAAFENSALVWSADHRLHHKFVDHEDDPYNINEGFWHAHIGWIMIKLRPQPPYTNVSDLERDRLVMWQDKHYVSIALFVSFVLPALIGLAWGGWGEALGAVLLAGVARVVFVQHMTFFINSLCHTIGRRPYSSRCTARDSALMALFTFGEGYHNYHHEFQHDYRNGVKPWQFDPTKWSIWILSKLGLATQLRRVPSERILLTEIAEKQRQLQQRIDNHQMTLPEQLSAGLHAAQQQLHLAAQAWEQKKTEYGKAVEQKLAESRLKVAALKLEFDQATARLRSAIEHWQQQHQLASAALA
ncbi:MAG: fatty acid desaturase [Verrucomicrobia bacterium]|nr:fatty acid desaturase [Verrucomicrobiota bacterium]MBI3869198.1 fatty acid desaturase [Verrucomicrobiota bacterium]